MNGPAEVRGKCMVDGGDGTTSGDLHAWFQYLPWRSQRLYQRQRPLTFHAVSIFFFLFFSTIRPTPYICGVLGAK